ncbi:uncharacterized protein LOC142231009 [Haematobia irritans]|uniref:uncharacterized protein LOC142231009 n=1 Tax=Haematobia irritans TaxID=7368 RepID=UPI003F4FDFBB
MHLKYFHFLKCDDIYRCCGSAYQNSSCFKRHIRTHHATFFAANILTQTDGRGKLYIKYHNNKKSVKSLDINKNDKPSTSGSKFEFVPENDALSCIQSLQYDDLPPENFKITWIGCSNFRINQIHNECENISKALQLWPQYKKPLGCQLIDLDFAVVQKNASHMVDFDEKMEKLLEYMKNHLAIYNKRSKQVLGSIEKHHFNEEKDECVLKLLWSLHGYLYPTKKFQRKGSDGKISHGRYSIKDSQESFIYVNENLQAIEEHVDFLIKRGEPIQPFIVAEENKDNFKINKFYVYLDGYFLPCTIFCRAMDLCFKSFHLFNAQYPQACLPFWTFIEKYLYNIENGNNNSKVTSLLSEISSV